MSAASERIDLASWPTPLEAAPRLARELGLGADDLWVKRDDLAGPGGGGNKIRKLEYTLAEAVAGGATTVLTTGAAQSNHARLTAAAARRVGLRPVLVLGGEQQPLRGNLLLDAVLGATVVWAGDVDGAGLDERARAETDRLTRSGERVYVVPFGGSSPVGARGYLRAANELLSQAPDLDVVVTAVGSGGTMAGLLAGLGAQRVAGVHCGAVDDPGERVADLASRVTDGVSVSARQLTLRTDHVGESYEEPPSTVRDAIALVAHSEGLILDPIYSGRAAAGLVSWVAEGMIRPGRCTVLLHTGGLPGLFGHDARLVTTSST